MKRLIPILSFLILMLTPLATISVAENRITSDKEEYISNKSIIDRLARLETGVYLKVAEIDKQFASLDKALVLAREQVEKDRVDSMDRIQARFVLIDHFRARIDAVERLISIGVGMAISLQFVLFIVGILVKRKAFMGKNGK